MDDCRALLSLVTAKEIRETYVGVTAEALLSLVTAKEIRETM